MTGGKGYLFGSWKLLETTHLLVVSLGMFTPARLRIKDIASL